MHNKFSIKGSLACVVVCGVQRVIMHALYPQQEN